MSTYRDNAFAEHGMLWRVTWCARALLDGAWVYASVYKTFPTEEAATHYADVVRLIPRVTILDSLFNTDPRVEEDARACRRHPLVPNGLHIFLG